MGTRVDAIDKARGAAVYAADVQLAGTAHVALVRSTERHARIAAIDTEEARAMPGVVGVFTARDLAVGTYGRHVRDVPVLPDAKVRFVGERVAAVVAETRAQAEQAAQLVVVDYEQVPALTDASQALQPDAARIHEAPWAYPRAVITAEDGYNLQSSNHWGDEAATRQRLDQAAHIVDRTYTTPSGHHGYIEPQACVVAPRDDGSFDVWVTDKAPYRLRAEVAACVGLEPEQIRIQPVVIGGDFGGKGGFGDVALCLELARLTGRPVKSVLSYAEDLAATNPRHATEIRVQLGCDASGDLQALHVDALVDGGAYAGFKPRPSVGLGGIEEAGSCYRLPAVHVEQRVAYTNSVPRGHFRAPGGPEMAFALESAIDELAAEVGLSPVDIRHRNLVETGEPNAHGVMWQEARGKETLQAVLEAAATAPQTPDGWLSGTGLGIGEHKTPTAARTSLRLTEEADGTIRVDVPMAETGTGSHTVARESLVHGLGADPDRVRVVHVPTTELAFDTGVGASRVTAGLSLAMEQAVEAWRSRAGEPSITVDVDAHGTQPVTSFCTQIARVAVHPESGEVRVLEVLTAVDVAAIVNPAAHQMQLDGGTAMGFGFACLEDLQIEDGQVWAANLGEFKIPSTRDMPALRTVLVTGGSGVGLLNTKAVGEITNVPTAAAIANAVADATGVRVRNLPVTAEDVWRAAGSSGDSRGVGSGTHA